MSKVSDSVARPIRTGTQATAAWLVTEGIDAFFYDMNDRQYGVLVGLLTMIFSWLQTNGENYFNKAFLRKIPEPPAPVVDEGGNNV